MPFEDVLEMRWHRTVDVEEVRHVDDVVDDLAAVGVDHRGVPVPVGPLIALGALDTRNGHAVRRRVALGVVPDEQHAVLLERGPRPGARQLGHPSGVGNRLAPAVATPAPIVEGTGDLVALDLTLRQITAQMPAVAVEDVELAVTTAEDHKTSPEGVDGVRLSVTEVAGQAQAVPASGESRGGSARFDLADGTVVGLQRRHRSVLTARPLGERVVFHSSDMLARHPPAEA